MISWIKTPFAFDGPLICTSPNMRINRITCCLPFFSSLHFASSLPWQMNEREFLRNMRGRPSITRCILTDVSTARSDRSDAGRKWEANGESSECILIFLWTLFSPLKHANVVEKWRNCKLVFRLSFAVRMVPRSLSFQQTPLNHDVIVSNAWAFFIAGYETTSTTLAFATYCLAKYPEVNIHFRNLTRKVGSKYNDLYAFSGSKLASRWDKMYLRQGRNDWLRESDEDAVFGQFQLLFELRQSELKQWAQYRWYFSLFGQSLAVVEVRNSVANWNIRRVGCEIRKVLYYAVGGSAGKFMLSPLSDWQEEWVAK